MQPETDWQKFRSRLDNLISGDYVREDIECVLNAFYREARRFLLHRESHQWQYRGEWEEPSHELRDLTIDFIAPLFARDQEGAFIELREFFHEHSSMSNGEIREKVYQLLNSIIQQQSVRLFKERDPFGRQFYRSLRYLTSKHPDWIQVRDNGQTVIRLRNSNNPVASETEVKAALRKTATATSSLTAQLEAILIYLLEDQKETVVVKNLLKTSRQRAEEELEASIATTENPDPVTREMITRYIQSTVTEIDNSLLRRYEEQEKLTNRERQNFRDAVKDLLMDFADGGLSEHYYDYLSGVMPELHSIQTYRNRYRSQFEYVAGKAKKIFSAKINNAFSI